jgi:hypothetical protein
MTTTPVRALGYAAAAWCIGFAGVTAWQLAAGPIGQPAVGQPHAAYASGLAIMGVLAGVLKLAGAAAAAIGGGVVGGLWAAWPVLGGEPGDPRGDRQWPAGPVGGSGDPGPVGPAVHLTRQRVEAEAAAQGTPAGTTKEGR